MKPLHSQCPSVTVVIPTRNRRQLLSEALSTVQEQTFNGWELLIVDDASTDDTSGWLGTLSDQRIRVYRQTAHAGRSAARNRGLSEARGENIMFLDDDDLLRPEALEELVGALCAHPDAVAATGACRILHANGDSVKVYRPENVFKGIIWPEMLHDWWANSGQNLYRTGRVRAVGGFDPHLEACEDRKLWLNLARSGPVVVIPSVVMDYRQHAGQNKPANLAEIRQAVWREFIGTLPVRDQRRAWRTRKSSELVQRSVDARAAGRFLRAGALQVSAFWATPWLLCSPLTARPLWWGLKKCLLRVSAP